MSEHQKQTAFFKAMVQAEQSHEHRELKELILPILGEIDTVASRSYLQAVVDDEYESPAIRRLAREILEQNLAVPR